MSITFQDVDPYPKAEFHNGVFVGRRLAEVEPADIGGFLQVIDTIPNNLWPFGNIGPTNAVLSEASVEGYGGLTLDSSFGDAASKMGYQKVRVHLTYTNDKMQVVGNRLLWEEINPGVKPFFLEAAEHFHLVWGDGRNVTGQPINAYMGMQNYSITQFRILMPPPAALLYPGCCNSVPYYLRTMAPYSFNPYTLLYLGCRIIPQSSIGLQPRKSIWHQFVHHPVNWNQFYRAETNQYETIYLPTGQPFLPHTPVDLNNVIG